MTAQPHGLADGRVHPPPAGLVELLGPDLGGRAACAGMAPAFDDEVHGELGDEREARLHRAATICTSHCPVQLACDTARLALGRQARGVWAGHVITSPSTTARRTA